MTYVLTFYILMLLVFFTYVGVIWAKYGVLPSISHSYYSLPDNKKFLFTLWCWGYAIPAMIVGSTPLMFFAGAGIAFVGAAAAYREKMTETVHIIGALSGILFSQLSTILDFDLWPITIGFAAIALPLVLTRFIKIKGKTICKNRTWWIEILAFISMAIVLGIKVVF